MTEPQPQLKKSDLPTRAASAIVMVTVAGLAIWLGGAVWLAFVGSVALGVLWEWWALARVIAPGSLARAAWALGGLAYIGLGAVMLTTLRDAPPTGWLVLLIVLLGVVSTDIGAYFAGRAIGGPKIAPRISPSKTWAGLGGGILGASAAVAVAIRIGTGNAFTAAVNAALAGEQHAVSYPALNMWPGPIGALVAGSAIAVIAQTGDFFESWMKRRAGVKDSGKLIPGHGGLFDRVDGLLAVMFVLGLVSVYSYLSLR